MKLVAIDTILRKLSDPTNANSYASNLYELLQLLQSADFSDDIIRYSQLAYCFLPGEFNFNKHVEQRIHSKDIENLTSYIRDLFPTLLANPTKKHLSYIIDCITPTLSQLHFAITEMTNVLFNPVSYRIPLHYYDGLIYSRPSHNSSTNFPQLNYIYYLYRQLADGTYYATRLDLFQGEHHSGKVTKEYGFTDLYNYLYPETCI